MIDIKKARQDAGLTQEELADLLRITPAALCRYERGNRPIPVATAQRIGRILQIDWWKLYDEED
jgi:transcriptional regulator with XRE-family HTH domain